MNEPLVSILIPCHNAAPWLRFTLESAIAQTWANTEIVMVDDGSTDESVAIAREFAAQVKVITQPNAGASAARNRAFQASTGEYIQYLDADDLLAPDKIERQMQLGRSVGPSVAQCGDWYRFRDTPADAVRRPEPLCRDGFPVDWLTEKLEHNRMMHPAAWLVPRQLADAAGPWDESLSLDDDGEYFSRVVLAARSVGYCNGAVSYYRSHLRNSLSQRRSDAAWRSAWHSLDLTSRRLLSRNCSRPVQHAVATATMRFVYEAYPFAADCRRAALARVDELGGSHLLPEGGRGFQLVRRLVGWKLAKRIVAAAHNAGAGNR